LVDVVRACNSEVKFLNYKKNYLPYYEWKLAIHYCTGVLRLLDPFGDFPSATNNIRPTQEGVAAAARHRHNLEVEDEWLLKDLIVIFVFVGILCTIFLMPESYSQKRKI
jgi:hypothetical protein